MFSFSQQRKISDDLAELRRNMRAGFQLVKEELDNHLETINQNTEEIQSAFEFLIELDKKVEKLTERLDQMDLSLNPSVKRTSQLLLPHREQEVFVTLLLSSERLSLQDVARKLGLTLEMVDNYVCSMIAKHVPILRELDGETCWVSLDPTFKELQARQGVIRISEDVAESLLSEL